MKAKNSSGAPFWICGQRKGKYNPKGSIWEFQGVFDKKVLAETACMNECYFIFPVELNKRFPDKSVKCKKGEYPYLLKKLAIWLAIFLFPAMLYAAPSPYPITIDSRIPSVPGAEAARNATSVFRISFKDNGTASDVTGYIPFMSWSTSSLASTISTSSYSVVSLTNGTVDFTFTGTNVNYTPGRYIYECGIKTGTVISVYRSGIFTIRGSPYAAGGSTVAWTTNVNWSQVIGTPTTIAGYGITDAAASGQTWTNTFAWAHEDPTNRVYWIVCLKEDNTIAGMNLDTLGGTCILDLCTRYKTNSQNNYTTIVTGKTASVVAAEIALTNSVLQDYWVGINPTNRTNITNLNITIWGTYVR